MPPAPTGASTWYGPIRLPAGNATSHPQRAVDATLRSRLRIDSNTPRLQRLAAQRRLAVHPHRAGALDLGHVGRLVDLHVRADHQDLVQLEAGEVLVVAGHNRESVAPGGSRNVAIFHWHAHATLFKEMFLFRPDVRNREIEGKSSAFKRIYKLP